MSLKVMIIFAIILIYISGCANHKEEISCKKRGIADPTKYLDNISILFKQEWPHNRTINIVCHGHSVPAGYFKTPLVDTFNAYPHLLHEGLKRKYPLAVINVIVTAIGGENSEQGMARFEKEVLNCHPDLILIDYALNDRSIGLERAKKAWASMIEKSISRDIKILLLTPTPDKRSDMNDSASPLNLQAEQIRQLAMGYNVGLVDSYGAFKKYVKNGGMLDDLMSQVNHLNRQGHELVVMELLKWFPE